MKTALPPSVSCPICHGRHYAAQCPNRASRAVPCQRPSADPDAWYPISDKADATQADPSPERARELEALAAELCAGCPLVDECLDRGLAEPYGIWGGTAPHTRRAIRRTRAALATGEMVVAA